MTQQKTAEELAKKQREISIAEFFEKNRHLLGFDNPRKALLTAVKEGVDNALDACEEARILPEVNVEMIQLAENRFRVVMEDNGPGIIPKQVPKIFAKLLYGSKFHKLAQSRGQQGIGISAAVLYAQLTTGKPASITSKTGPDKKAYHCKLKINTQTNNPDILEEKETDWEGKNHGTRIEIDMEGTYIKGRQSVDEYLKETAIVNPHVTIIYTTPEAQQIIFPRVTETLPTEAKEIQPHPYGVELGRLMKMLETTETKTLQQFLTTEFCRVGASAAKEICENASLLPTAKPHNITRDMTEQLMNGIQKTKIMAPPTDCISPITAELLERGLRKEINAEFYCSASRPPAVYRGNPFIIEVALAYGGEQEADSAVRIMRFANRVPLLYQQGACAITSAIQNTAWRSYGLNQSAGSLPVGPCTIVVHMSSVWVPFTSESKEALAHYPEITKEIKLALQDAGRKLASFISKKRRIGDEAKKRSYIEKYIPHVAEAITEIASLTVQQKQEMEQNLRTILEKTRGELEDISIDNPDYDPELAKIGQEEETEEEIPPEEETKTRRKAKEEKKTAGGDDDDDDKDDDHDEEEHDGQTRLM
ncbi:TPA: DNA topoisomerase VI subunit B [Candidatus Woesearchaeota archaeon]|nr:DNA topoisomerase VI subunit B [Candidatus Woesearchaeota archaeon]